MNTIDLFVDWLKDRDWQFQCYREGSHAVSIGQVNYTYRCAVVSVSFDNRYINIMPRDGNVGWPRFALADPESFYQIFNVLDKGAKLTRDIEDEERRKRRERLVQTRQTST